MGRAAKGLAGLALGLGALAATVWVIGAGETFRTLARLRAWQGVALVGVALTGTAFTALALALMFRRSGERVPAWLLFRLSGTEPVARVYAEACSPKDLKRVLDAGKRFVAPGAA